MPKLEVWILGWLTFLLSMHLFTRTTKRAMSISPDLAAHLLVTRQTSPTHYRGTGHTGKIEDNAEDDGGVQSNDQMARFLSQSHEAGKTGSQLCYR